MKKHNILLTGFILPLLCLSLQGCYCNPSDAIQSYNINLTQPDGSVPKSGWAMVYEKHLDPNTSYASQRIPISDTITWGIPTKDLFVGRTTERHVITLSPSNASPPKN